MAKWKLRKDLRVGALAAENDTLLDQSFYDAGYLAELADTQNPKFLLLGRTGAGKTALIHRLQANAEKVSTLHPDELSLQYLQNSSILKALAEWGVNLEIFYKFLWRHVCILELIRLRYGQTGDVASTLQRVLGKVFQSGKERTREESLKYLTGYADEYWVKADTRIKKIVEDVQEKLTSDHKIAAELSVPITKVGASLAKASEQQTKSTVEREVVERAQSVLSDFLIADLNKVVELLSKHAFEGNQRGYYLVIDDLDQNWMPDDEFYLELIKSLLIAVLELNQRLNGVKIIVALRENIYSRVFKKASLHEPQREKWKDVQLRIRWSPAELCELINRRLAVVFKSQYTHEAPTIHDLLPVKQREGVDGVEYVLQRTMLRPRDIIDFVNTAIDTAASGSRIGWQDLYRAEAVYSKRRLESLFDEWRDNYYSLPALYPLLRSTGGKFVVCTLDAKLIDEFLVSEYASKCTWLAHVQTEYIDNRLTLDQVRIEIVRALFTVGLVGWRDRSNQLVFSFDEVSGLDDTSLLDATFEVHRMFHTALNISLAAPN